MHLPPCRVKNLLMKRLNKSLGQYRLADRSGADDFAAVYGGANDRITRADAAVAVLEIGTGSGYPNGNLAHLVQHVCSVERIKGLQWQARRRLKNLDLHNVSTRHGDGWQGWQARAPFDAIIVTAAPPKFQPR